jgi:hypothetical protein
MAERERRETNGEIYLHVKKQAAALSGSTGIKTCKGSWMEREREREREREKEKEIERERERERAIF